MKKFLTVLSLVLLGFASTSCYDDSKLWDSVNDLDARVETLENLCTQMNSNLTALTELINAMTMGDVIIGVTPVKENGVEVGWQILLKDGGVVTIYHGKDGANGADGKDGANGTDGTNGTNGQDAVAPEFGVELIDGVYYWTLDGEVVVDKDGNKVPVTGPAGEDGTNGVTPKLKIENSTWYVSYDGEKTWEEVGAAVAVGITNVETVGGNLVISMADGKEISVPLGSSLEVVLGEFDATALQYGSDLEIPYTIEGAEGEVVVFLLREGDGFAVELVEETATSGKVIVSQLEATATEKKLKVGIFASGEDGTTVSKSVRLVSGVFATVEGNQETYAVEPAGGKIEFKVATNAKFDVKVPEGCDWITYIPQTKAVEEVALSFEVAANQGEDREATVEVVSGDVKLSFTVTQKGGFTREETLVGNYLVTFLWVYGGTGPEYGAGGWVDMHNKTWWFDEETGHGIWAELDNYLEITLDSFNDDFTQSTGKCINWAGKDGKNWDTWFYNNYNASKNEYRNPDAPKDGSNFYRQIPIGESTWVRDYTVTPNTVTFTDAEGKKTVLEVYDAPYTFVPGYNDSKASGNTRTFPRTGVKSPISGVNENATLSFHAVLKGEKNWDKNGSELDKLFYMPRDLFIDVKKVDEIPAEAKTTEDKWVPEFPEEGEPENELPATLAGTYKYSTDFVVGGKDGAITGKGLKNQYSGWAPMKESLAKMYDDIYVFSATGTDANGNETGVVSFQPGENGTWDYSVWPDANTSYDATELYSFIEDQSPYVYDRNAKTITFTTRGAQKVVKYLVPGDYGAEYLTNPNPDKTKQNYIEVTSTFAMDFDMGYTESRVPTWTDTSKGFARHYVWARNYILCLQKQ